jgi:hypothetical protein
MTTALRAAAAKTVPATRDMFCTIPPFQKAAPSPDGLNPDDAGDSARGQPDLTAGHQQIGQTQDIDHKATM